MNINQLWGIICIAVSAARIGYLRKHPSKVKKVKEAGVLYGALFALGVVLLWQ